MMKSGFPPIIIKKEKRSEYYDALDKSHTAGDYSDFVQIVAGQLLMTEVTSL